MSNKIKLSILGGLAALLMLTGIGSAKAFAKGIAPDSLEANTSYDKTTYYVYHAKVITPREDGKETMSHHTVNFTSLLQNMVEFQTIHFKEKLTWTWDDFGGAPSEVSRQVIFQNDSRNHVLYGKDKLTAEAMEKKLTESLPENLKDEIKDKFPGYDKVKIYRLVNEGDGIHVDLELVNTAEQTIPEDLILSYTYISNDNNVPLPDDIKNMANSITPKKASKGQAIDFSKLPKDKSKQIGTNNWVFDGWYVDNALISGSYTVNQNTKFVGKWKPVPATSTTDPNPLPDPNPSPNPSPDPGPTIIEPITDPEKNPDNNPGNNNPSVEIVDDSTPLSFPIEDESAILEDEAPVEEVEEDEVPLSEEVEEISIEEDDTPLTDIPKTGDNDSLIYSFYAVAVSILSFFGFLVWKRVRK